MGVYTGEEGAGEGPGGGGAVRFAYTIAYVRNVHRSVTFYEQAFGLKRRFVDESGQYAEMETGKTTLAFASNELGASNLPGRAPGRRGDSLHRRGRGRRLPFGAGGRGNESGRAEDKTLGPDRRLRKGPGWRARRDREPDVVG